jgi:outer membrane protein assembly factor BamB
MNNPDKNGRLPLKFSLVFILFLITGILFNCKQERKDYPHRSENGEQILSQTNISKGIYVLLNDRKCRIALDLIEKSELLIFIQLSDEKDVERAREIADSAGFYGTRLYVEKSNQGKINLADNIADAVIYSGNDGNFSEKEIIRVIHPKGIALIGDKKIIKPFPEGVDDWTHPYHGPDNNPQSEDKLIKAPYLTQFLAKPHYGPATQIAVASNGIIFKGFGNVAFHKREEKFLNTLAAFNGYNGTLLWKRDLVPGVMLHRNTMIATPHTLFVGDDKSCKLIEPLTGRIKGEIKPDPKISGGTFWKWMGMEKDILYAVIGEQEEKDPVMRWRRQKHGWPWSGISKGFNQRENTWGFGNDLLAINPENGKIVWHHHENRAIDTRASCMKNGRIYIFRFGTYLRCLDAESGDIVWQKTPENAPQLFEAIGDYLPRQGFTTNWRTRFYLTAGDDAIYFAGPQIDKLLAVSTKDGSVLWQDSFNNYQLVLRKDGLYAISGPWRTNVSKKFDPLSGEVLANLPAGRRACTRPTGTSDAIFFRANDGTVRLDLESNQPLWMSPMRPDCFNGVTIANGMIYWWPYVCDCQLSIYGITAVASAGDFKFDRSAKEETRLIKGNIDADKTSELLITSSDWPTFRKNNSGNVKTDAVISKAAMHLWQYPDVPDYYSATNVLGHEYNSVTTPPVTADGIVFYGNSEGILRALDINTGKELWKSYTGGSIRIPPTIWKGYVLVGSGDGYIYNFAALSGKLVWKFRAAPVERKIPVYGNLLSTWPAASGLLVKDGIVYGAAGILNYDGIHVYALDAETGRIIWQNNTSGHLYKEAKTGASVFGHMLMDDKNLYLASGTSLSPAVYDLKTGTCLNDPEPLKTNEAVSPRGWELYRIGDHIIAGGKPFYSDPKDEIYDVTVKNKMLHTSNGKRDILWINQKKIMCYPPITKEILNNAVSGQHFAANYNAPLWATLNIDKEPFWEYNCDGSEAVALTKKSVIVAGKDELAVLDLRNGKTILSFPLDYPPIPWGLAVSRDGKIIVVLQDGSVHCFGGDSTIPVPYLSTGNTYFIDSTKVRLVCDTRGTQIYYTLDGSTPTQKSLKYIKPFFVNESKTLKMRAYSAKLMPSFIVTKKLSKVSYAHSQTSNNIKPGIYYDYYKGYFATVADLDNKQPQKSGLTNSVAISPEINSNNFGIIFKGYILIPDDDIYTFYLTSNDGSKLYINNEEVLDNDGLHTALEKSAKIALQAGEYPFMVKYFQEGGSKALKMSWESKKIKKEEIPPEALLHKEGK